MHSVPETLGYLEPQLDDVTDIHVQSVAVTSAQRGDIFGSKGMAIDLEDNMIDMGNLIKLLSELKADETVYHS